MAGGDALERLLLELSEPQLQEALDKMVTLLKNLNESGLLDVLIALTDREAVERLSRILVNTGSMKLMDNLDKVLAVAGEAADAMSRPVEPMPLSKLVASLADPEVARGLARLIQVLKAMGRA